MSGWLFVKNLCSLLQIIILNIFLLPRSYIFLYYNITIKHIWLMQTIPLKYFLIVEITGVASCFLVDKVGPKYMEIIAGRPGRQHANHNTMHIKPQLFHGWLSERPCHCGNVNCFSGLVVAELGVFCLLLIILRERNQYFCTDQYLGPNVGYCFSLFYSNNRRYWTHYNDI